MVDTIDDIDPPFRSGDSAHADRGQVRERLYEFIVRMQIQDPQTITAQDWALLLHLAHAGIESHRL